MFQLSNDGKDLTSDFQIDYFIRNFSISSSKSGNFLVLRFPETGTNHIGNVIAVINPLNPVLSSTKPIPLFTCTDEYQRVNHLSGNISSKRSPMSSELELKVVLVGEQAVGKTSIIQRVCTGGFSPECQATLGASFHSKSLTIDGEEVIFEMWDTAGQERYRSMATMYLRGAHVVLLVYSIGDRVSFSALADWLRLIEDKCDPNVVVFLVGNKLDLGDSAREVSVTEGMEFGNERGMAFSEISALSGAGIDTLFAAMGRVFLEDRTNNRVNQDVGEDLTRKPTKKNCC